MADDKRRDLWFWLAVFFGSGLAPKAPGTAGSLASLVVWAPMVLAPVDAWVRVVAALAFFLVGIVAADRAAKVLQNPDPKEVVIDEVAGQGLALALAGPTVASVVVGFALFRLFDVWKPWPIRVADRRIKGGLGIMLDDVLAGVIACACLTGLERAWPHLATLFEGAAP